MMMICFFIAHSAFADVTVDGFCYLEGETDHSGTKVLFNSASPSAVTDSVYTNSDGSYLTELILGIYTVHFSHTEWLTYTIADEIIIFEDITLEDVMLTSALVEVSGPQSGTWTSDYLYQVIGDISVPEGETLIIEPGVTIKFMDFYSLNISGTLLASGTETDSIIFTSGQTFCKWGDWNEIKFEDSSNDNSIISHSRIEHGGSGVHCSNSSPNISNNNFINNAYGIECNDHSSPTISYNTFDNFTGINCYDFSTPFINNNTFSNNTYVIRCSYSSPTISNNIINNNSGHVLK